MGIQLPLLLFSLCIAAKALPFLDDSKGHSDDSFDLWKSGHFKKYNDENNHIDSNEHDGVSDDDRFKSYLGVIPPKNQGLKGIYDNDPAEIHSMKENLESMAQEVDLGDEFPGLISFLVNLFWALFTAA